jgi:hypothetical protein
MSVAGTRRLAFAILLRAVKDAQASDPVLADEARCWLTSSQMCINLLEMLEIDVGLMRRWINSLEPLRQPALFRNWRGAGITNARATVLTRESHATQRSN